MQFIWNNGKEELIDELLCINDAATVNHERKCENSKNSKWISCKEQLPPYGVKVLACSSSTRFVGILKSTKENFYSYFWLNEHGEHLVLESVDYWQYLPELPSK